MRRRERGIARRRVRCPECGETFTVSWRPDVRRFKAKLHGCPACDFTGRRGQFEEAP